MRLAVERVGTRRPSGFCAGYGGIPLIALTWAFKDSRRRKRETAMAERFETGRWEKTTCQCPKGGGVRTCGPANHHAVGTMLQSAVIRLARRWTTRVDEVLAEGGLNAGQLAVLNLLAQRPSGLIQREAADALALSEAVMSTRVTGLLAAGLVERQALKGDRRAHLLRLTDSG